MYQLIYLTIDPGTNMLGTTINAITHDNQWVVLHTHTTNIRALLQHRFPPHLIELHGERFFKALLCGEVIFKFAKDWDATRIVSESPYMGKFPQAFGALTECLYAMRYHGYQYDPYISFDTIDPATIKYHVGVKGNSGDKALMKMAVQHLTGTTVDLRFADEHSVDSMAVGYAWYRSVWLGLSKG